MFLLFKTNYIFNLINILILDNTHKNIQEDTHTQRSFRQLECILMGSELRPFI